MVLMQMWIAPAGVAAARPTLAQHDLFHPLVVRQDGNHHVRVAGITQPFGDRSTGQDRVLGFPGGGLRIAS